MPNPATVYPSVPRVAGWCLALIALCVSADMSSATITLTVNTVTEDLYFSGSATGSPLVAGSVNVVAWETAFLDQGDLVGTLPGALTTSNGSVLLAPYYQTGTYSAFLFTLEHSGTQTLTAHDNVVFSYSLLTDTQKNALESLAASGASIPLQSGSGYGAMNVQTVPEPATCGLIAFTGITLLLRRKMRRVVPCSPPQTPSELLFNLRRRLIKFPNFLEIAFEVERI